MQRRQALQYLTALLGGSISAPALAGMQGQVQRLEGAPFVASSAEQEALLAEIAEVIIPTTQTPGAKAAGVAQYIVKVVRDCYPLDFQKKFYADLTQFEQDTRAQFGRSFVECDNTQRNARVRASLEAAKTAGNQQGQPFFFAMKELTVTGYFSSEIGATQALEYVPIPGSYQGCVPLKPGQKAWAL
jgi:Gluconate 2-dehydrogenase subunit 3